MLVKNAQLLSNHAKRLNKTKFGDIHKITDQYSSKVKKQGKTEEISDWKR